jgi:predicted enzyme related to lactoylglutathione lyase
MNEVASVFPSMSVRYVRWIDLGVGTMSFGSDRGLSGQMIMTNRLVHLELHTTDLARACAFYEQVCGWKPERIHAGGGSYTAMELGGVGGGVVECGSERSVWLAYVAVDDLVEATRRAE